MKLSVIIPVFNCEKFLRKAVMSLLKEDIRCCELIVVDDGSTDGTISTLRGLPVQILSTGRNRGPSAARNIGITAAKGDYITFFDSDDVLVPSGLKWRLSWLEKNANYSAVGGIVAAEIDDGGKRVSLGTRIRLGQLSPRFLSRAKILQGVNYSCLSALYLYRADLVRKVGFYNENWLMGEDREYLFRVLCQVPLIPLFRRPVFLKRRHAGNLSQQILCGTAGRPPESRKDLSLRYLDLLTLLMKAQTP